MADANEARAEPGHRHEGTDGRHALAGGVPAGWTTIGTSGFGGARLRLWRRASTREQVRSEPRGSEGPQHAPTLPRVGEAGANAIGSIVRIHGLPLEWKVQFPDLQQVDDIYGWLAGYFAADGDVDMTGSADPQLGVARAPQVRSPRVLRRRHRDLWDSEPASGRADGSAPSELHLVGIMRGDLTPAFFLIDSHRRRFVAGRGAVERRGWNVVSVVPAMCSLCSS